ncbi:MAG: hypothetical protein ACXVCN_15315 [Bdellovibrio sp.]
MQIEEQLENLLQKKKEEFSFQSVQMANIRNLINKIKANEKSIDIRKDFQDIQGWTTSARENFLSQVVDSVRVVYGKFPELDKFLSIFEFRMSEIDFPAEILSCDIMKLGEAGNQMGAVEVTVLERKSDYSHFFAAFPESILFEERTEKIEEAILESFEYSLNEVFYDSKLEFTTRLFCAQDIQQFLAPREIVFRCLLRMVGLPDHCISLLIPFSFVHASRTVGNSELSMLSRILQKSIIQLSEEQILRKTKDISNENYLLTALLAEPKTRQLMFKNLTPTARDHVSLDMVKLVENIRRSWEVN